MPCITISRLPYTSGREIARSAASRLGYALVDPEIFEDASKASKIPESKLQDAFHQPPSFFGMSSAARRRAVAWVSAALAKRFLADNVIYHGPCGHVLVPGISHVLKVRITAQLEDRINNKIQREPNLSTAEAEKALVREDRYRSAIAKQVFGVDEEDSELFDLVINTSQVDSATATEIIASTVGLKRYQPMTYSIACMENLELSLRARAHMVEEDPDVEVLAENGRIRVRTRASSDAKRRVMREKASALEGVGQVEMEVLGDSLSR